jgi:hypothetical protein
MVHFQYQKHYFQLQQVITKWSKWTKQMKTICTIKQKTKKQQLLNCFQLLKTKVLIRNVLYQWHLVARRQALVFHQRGYRFRNFFFKAKQHRVQNCFKQWKQMYFIRQLQNEQWVICKMYLLKELQQAHVSLTKVHKYIRVKWFQRFKRHALWREHRADCFFRHRHLTKVLNKWCHVFVAIKQERLLQNVRQQMKRMSPCYPTIGLKNSGMVDEDTFSIVQQQYSSEQLKNKQRKVQFDLKPSIQNVTRGQQQKQQQQQQQQPLFDTRKSTKTTTNTTATHRKMNSCSTSKEELQIRALYSTARGYGQRFAAKKKQSVNKCLSPVSVILEQDRSFPPLQRKKQSSIAHAQATSRHVAHSTNNKLLLEDCLANFTGEVDDIEKWLANSMEQATNMLQNSTNSGQIEPIATIAATPPPSSTSTFSTTAAVGAVPIIPSPPVAVTPAVVVIEHSTPATVSISRSVSEKELVQQQQEEQVEEEKPTPTTKQAIGSFMSSEDHALLDSIDEEMKHVQQLLTCHKMDTAIKKNQQKQQVDDQCITRLKTLASTSSTSESTTMLSIVDTESTSSVLVPQCKKRIDSGILSVEMDASVHSITTSSESSSAIFSDELSLETLVGLDPYSPPKRPLQKSQRDSMLNSEFSLQEISSSLTSPMDTVENNPVAMEGNTRQQQLVQEEQKKEQKDVLMYHVFFNTVLTYYTSQLSSINRKGTFKGIVLDMLRDLNLLTEDFYLTQIQNVLNKMSIQQDDFILLAFLEQVAKFHPCLDFVRLNQVQFTEQVDMLSKELGVFISMEYFESYPNLMLLLKHHIVPLLLSLQQQQQQYQVNWWTRPHKIPWILYTQDDFLEVVEKNVPWIQNLLKTILLKDGGCSLDFFLQFAQECKLMPKLFTSTQLTTCFQQSCGPYSFSNGRAKFVELVECLVRCSLLFKAPSSLFDKKESRLENNFIKPKQRPMSSSSTPKEETNLMTLLYAIEGKGSILHKPMKEIHPKNTTTTVENIPCPATRPASPEHVAHKASVKLIKAQRNNLRLLPRPSIQSKATGSIATEVRPLPKYPPRSRPPPISPLLQSQTSTRTTTTLLKKDQENKEKSLVEKNQRLIASKSKVAQQKKQPSKKTLLLNQLYKQDQKEMRKRTNTLLYDFNVDPFSSAILTPSRPRCRPRSSMSVRPTAMVTPCSSPIKQVQITNSTPPISEDNVDAIGLKKDNGETDEDILKQLLKFKETSADEEEQTLMKEVATMLDDFGILVDGSECKSSKKKNVPLRPPEQSIEQDFVLSSDNLDLKSIWRTMFSKDSMEDLNDIFEDAHIGSEITHVDVKDPFLNHLTNVDRFSIARTTKKQFELSQTPPLSSVLFHGIHTLSSEPVSSHVLAHVNDPNLDFLTNPLTNPLGASNCQLFGANDEDIDMKHEAKETKVDG